MAKQQQPETTDVFLWANQIDGMKGDLFVELFLVNKNFTPYRIRIGEELQRQLNAYFLFDVINAINTGAATGMSVRDMTFKEDADNILPRTDLSNVSRAESLVYIIEKETENIVYFVEEEHEMKRMAGIIARFTHKTDKKVKFYIAKQLQPSGVVNGGAAIQFWNDKLEIMEPEVTFKLPLDNQVLIVNNDIFAFNLSKFEKLFKFSVREQAMMEEKGKVLDQHFKLSFPDLIGEVSFLAKESATNKRKLLKVDTDNLMSQDAVIDIADNLGVELMVDDAGKIIIMDNRDLSNFLDIVNDNFVEGSSTGKHYLATSKKPFEAAGE